MNTAIYDDYGWLHPQLSDETGLVGVGGDLSVERLLAAYRRGIFPWFDSDSPILWWSPDPRAIFELDGLIVTQRLARTVRSAKFTHTLDRAFRDVMLGCADRPETGTWITNEMIEAYCELHRLGYAHSVEVWQGDLLAGGIYGVGLGGFFAGESMFHRVTDASKVAMVHLFNHLRQRGYTLFDTQMVTPHTVRMGAIEISREQYLIRLQQALSQNVTWM